jgi:hypothetical protein
VSGNTCNYSPRGEPEFMSERNPIFFVLERSRWFIFFKGERSLSSFRETLSGIQAGEILLFFMFSERTIIEITLEDMLMPQQIEDC